MNDFSGTTGFTMYNDQTQYEDVSIMTGCDSPADDFFEDLNFACDENTQPNTACTSAPTSSEEDSTSVENVTPESDMLKLSPSIEKCLNLDSTNELDSQLSYWELPVEQTSYMQNDVAEFSVPQPQMQFVQHPQQMEMAWMNQMKAMQQMQMQSVPQYPAQMPLAQMTQPMMSLVESTSDVSEFDMQAIHQFRMDNMHMKGIVKPKRSNRKNRMSLVEKRALEAKLFPEDKLGDLSGTTSSKVRGMSKEERELVLYKRKLRNRQSARRSREKRRMQQLQETNAQVF
mmetsp:Transcript_10910/g.33449  ORF Transcript_10910/g.33449 Transcript_10910/m.33449 type:complete len:286 (+) Transcript_10910:84-941(+)